MKECTRSVNKTIMKTEKAERQDSMPALAFALKSMHSPVATQPELKTKYPRAEIPLMNYAPWVGQAARLPVRKKNTADCRPV